MDHTQIRHPNLLSADASAACSQGTSSTSCCRTEAPFRPLPSRTTSCTGPGAPTTRGRMVYTSWQPPYSCSTHGLWLQTGECMPCKRLRAESWVYHHDGRRPEDDKQ